MHQKSILLITSLLLLCSYNITAQLGFEFVENKGQWDGPFKYKSSTGYTDVFLKSTGITYLIKGKDNRDKIDEFRHGHTTVPPTLDFFAYHVNFIGCNTNATIQGSKPQKHYYNYFLGNDPKKWASDIHPCMVVDYTELYSGINMHFYSNGDLMKYDFIVAPNADVSQIKLGYEGVQKIAIVNKELHLTTTLGDNVEMAPYAYQFVNGEKVEVACSYKLDGNVVSFKMGKNYNKSLELIIDPTLIFCTFTGSTADNWGYTATPGANGTFYAGGIVAGAGYPNTTGFFQVNYAGGTAVSGNGYACDIGITKFNATGTAYIYCTYIGGSDNDQPHSIVEDASGNLVVMGRTYSSNFPTSGANAYDATHNGAADIFVCKLNATGTAMVGSTYIGGNSDDCVNYDAGYTTFNALKYFYGDDSRSEVILDAAGNILVASNTKSSNFPTAAPSGYSVYQSNLAGGQDGVFFKLNPTCSNLIYSTYLGGSGEDGAYVLHVVRTQPNILYIGGGTTSTNMLPASLTGGVINTSNQGGSTDGFLFKFNLASNAFTKATYIGTNAYDQVFGIKDDLLGNVYLLGHTMGAYPVSTGVYSNTGGRHFIDCLDSNLAVRVRSTRFGSNAPSKPNLSLNAFMVDTCGNVYVSGWGDGLATNATATGGTNGMPISTGTGTNAPIQPTTDNGDFYFIVFSAGLTNLLYATYFGQNGVGAGNLGAEHVDGGTSRFDANGVIYQAICANCGKVQSFPTTPGVVAPTNPSNNCNLAAFKLAFEFTNANAVASASPSTVGCAPFTISLVNSSTNATSYNWDFGNGGTSVAFAPVVTYTTPGNYTITLIASNNTGCTLGGSSDTAYIYVTVLDDTISNNFVLSKLDSCTALVMGINNLSSYYGGNFSSSTTWSWNFGDGTSSNLQNPGSHTYPALGTYLVTLTITDPNACNSPVTISKPITFTNNYIDASFTIPPSGCAPFPVSFNPTTSGVISNFNWNFGDGGTSTASSPTHTYTGYGPFTATLIVGNPNSCNKFDTSTANIFINGNINGNFTYTKVDTCDPYIISVNNTSTANPAYSSSINTWTTYTWNWGDGTTLVSQSPGTHVYTAPGTYTITLTINDSTACNNPVVVTRVVNFVDNNVRALFDLPDTVCQPYTHIFTNGSSNVSTYSWNFGDGSVSNLAVPTHTFGTLGTFTVNLITANPTTCNKIDSTKEIITVVESPIADFSYQPFPPLPNKPVIFTNLSTGAVAYVWDFGDGTGSTEVNPTHVYNKTLETQVCLTAINEYGCENKKCLPIAARVINIVDVPTGFTPNGDGKNDIVPVKGYGIDKMLFRIYNRWGELVFETDKVDVGWDGSYKGVQQEMDSYAYTLSVVFTDGTPLTKNGNITLIR